MKRQPGYKVQNGCHNCKHVFIKGDYDESSSYYCTLGATKRPLCGSVAMDECHWYRRKDGRLEHVSDKEGSKVYKAWDKWAKKNEVADCGICDNWEQK